jgi:hypothetical protein
MDIDIRENMPLPPFCTSSQDITPAAITTHHGNVHIVPVSIPVCWIEMFSSDIYFSFCELINVRDSIVV